MGSLQLSFILIVSCIALVGSETIQIRTLIIGPYHDLYVDEKDLEKSALGVGRRSYTLTSGPGVQRRPLYNFGLGKRGNPYLNGARKLHELDYDDQSDNYNLRFDDTISRQFPFNFGGGIRAKRDGKSITTIPVYNFGLGER